MRPTRVIGYVSATALVAGLAATVAIGLGALDPGSAPDAAGPIAPSTAARATAKNAASPARAARPSSPRDGRAAAEIERQFPGQAALVLDAAGVLAPAGDPGAPEAYYPILGAGRDDGPPAPHVAARLPARGTDPVRFTAPDGFSIDVRESGAHGAAEPAGRGVAYPRDGGYSFWTAADGGYEEWLLVTGGRPGEIASWVVPHAALRQAGDAVEVLDERGEPRMKVTAPHAFRSGGARVAAHVRVDHNRIVVGVDLPGDRFQEPLLVDPLWQVTADAPSGRAIHTANRLLDGRVLAVGGIDDTGNLTSSAAIFDPVAETWQPASPLFDVLYAASSVTLLDGRVLVTNGTGGSTPGQTLGALYDPASNTWTTADPARSAIGPGTRLGQKSVLLPDGKVLLTGNYCCPGNEAQIYDPALDQFFPVASMQIPRNQHTLTLLADGTVLAAGTGTTNPSALDSNRAEIFVPDTSGPTPDYLNGTWQQVGNMTAGHIDHFAALLTTGPDAGKALVCGGYDGATFPGFYVFTNACDLYDPVTKTFSATGPLNGIRQLSGTGNGGSMSATVAAGPLAGSVFAVGGYPSMSGTEIYDQATGAWQCLSPMINGRLRHTTTALADGRILAVGGTAAPGTQSFKQTEILDPALSLPDFNCNGVPDPVEPCPSGFCVVVAGNVTADSTANCSIDPGEIGVAGRMIRADDGTDHYFAVTDDSGFYQLTLPYGTQFTVSLVPNDYTVASPACAAPTTYTPSPWGDTYGADFSLLASCSGAITMISLPPPDPNACPNLLPPHYASPCPGSPWRYCAVVTNTGSIAYTSGTTVAFFLDPTMTAVGVDPGTTDCPGSYISGAGTNYLDYDVSALPAGLQCKVCIDVSVNAPNTCWNSMAFLIPSCDNAQFYFDPLQQCSQCSCDPNDKAVSPEGCGVEHLTPPTELTYTVRFHNIGKGPAHNVVIRDDIDPNLDPASLRVVTSSHHVTDVRVLPPQGLVVSFNGIELPADQFDPVGSQGYVVFKLTPRPGLSAGTALANTADVYFDNNPPVTTNTVVNKLNPAGVGAPTCVSLQRGLAGGVEDAHIASDKPTKNWGTSQSLTAGGVGGGSRQALVKWDLSSIPACSTIVSATASFDVLLGGGAPVDLHRVVYPWSEASVDQQTFGARYDRDAAATLPAGATPSADVTNLVQAWVNGTAPNQGVLLSRDPGGMTVFHSSEVAEVSKRPRLDVCYYPAP